MKHDFRIMTLTHSLEKHTCLYLRDELLITGIQSSSALKEVKQMNLHEATAIVSIAGDFNVLIAFSFETPLLQQLTRHFLYDGDQVAALDEEDCLDMASEVINIIVGLCTPDLSKDDNIPVLFSPPVVLDKAKTIRHTKSSLFYVIELQTTLGRLDIHCIGPKQLFDNYLNIILEPRNVLT
jgi:CheY-specific phosphatase CheX